MRMQCKTISSNSWRVDIHISPAKVYERVLNLHGFGLIAPAGAGPSSSATAFETKVSKALTYIFTLLCELFF